MRILAIRGSNLASLAGDFEVDFGQGPLADAGIFAITGPTGAGKSTLLDAMSLALFDRIPRLAGAPSSGHLSQDELNPRDPRAILRHGTAEGHAELDFVARDGRSYRCRWSVRRARSKVDSKIQQSRIELKCLDTGEQLGGTKRETLAEIEKIIGLNGDQFGRAVVLAQGEFEAFIKANGDERAQLLERLTGAQIYTAIGKIAFEKAKEIRAGYEQIKQQIALQKGLSDDERRTLEETVAEKTADRDVKKKEHAKIERAARWTTRLFELQQKVADCEAAQDEARKAVEAAAPRRVLLDRRKRALAFAGDWKQLAERREGLKQAKRNLVERKTVEERAGEAQILAMKAEQQASVRLDEAKKQKRGAEAELKEAREADSKIALADDTLREEVERLKVRETAHADALAESKAAEKAFRQAREQRAELETWSLDNAGFEKLATNEASLKEDLSSHAAIMKEVAELEKGRESSSRQVEEARAALGAAKQEFDVASAEHTSALEALKVARAVSPPEGRRPSLESERQLLQKVKSANEAEEQARQRQSEAASELAEAQEWVRKLRVQQAQQREELKDVLASLPALKARKDEAEKARIRIDAASEEGIVALREALVEGEPCPVCGATEHQLDAVASILGGAARDAHEQATAASEALEKAQSQQIKLDTQIKEVSKSLSQAEQAFDRKEQTFAARNTACEKFDDALADAIAKAGMESAVSRAELANRLDLISTELSNVAAAEENLSKVRQTEEEKRNARDDAREWRDQTLQAEHAAVAAFDEVDRELDAKLSTLNHLVSSVDRITKEVVDWQDLTDPVRWVAAKAEEWRKKQKRLAEIDAAMDALFKTKTNAAAFVSSIARDLQAASASHEHAQSKLAGAKVHRRTLLRAQSVADVEAKLDAAIETAEREQNKAANEALEATKNATEARSFCEMAEESVSEQEKARERAQDAFEKALAATDISAEDVAEAADFGSEAIGQEETELNELQTKLTTAKEVLKQRKQDLEAHENSDKPELDPATIQSQLEIANRALEAAETVLRNEEFRLREDDATRERTAGLREQLAEAQANGRVWEEIEELIGDAQGKKFRNFAQSLTLDGLLEFANERLTDLKPRYALQRAYGGDMLIEVIDNDMAGQIRGLQNLSGGERFLVSLALALGLAEMSTGRGVKIESLFIDEGFGALDSASLGQAVAVLEHLHAQGRRVGVISHVEEMKERIPVKVEVSPVSGGRSEISVSLD